MKVKDLMRVLSSMDSEKEVRVLDALHEPLPTYLMSHRAESTLETNEFICIVSKGKGLFPINREIVP